MSLVGLMGLIRRQKEAERTKGDGMCGDVWDEVAADSDEGCGRDWVCWRFGGFFVGRRMGDGSEGSSSGPDESVKGARLCVLYIV